MIKKCSIVLGIICTCFFLGIGTYESSAAQNGEVVINDKNFPQKEFRECIAFNCDTNRDGILSNKEIDGTTHLYMAYPETVEDWNITGIEYLTNLEKVEITGLFHNKGKIIGTFCNNERLAEVCFNIHNYKFSESEFSCLFPLDQLTKLKLGEVDLPYESLLAAKYIKSLEFELSTQGNLDFSGMKSLEVFKCVGSCNVKKMDFSANKKLKSIYVDSPSVRQLKLPKKGNVETLTLRCKALTSLDVTANNKLKKIRIYNLPITKMNLKTNKKLECLTVENTPIRDLDISKNTKLKEVSIHSGTLVVSDPESFEDWEIPWESIPWFKKSTYYTKIKLPKENQITRFTCFTKNKKIDLTRCKKLKHINVSDYAWVKLNRKWYKKINKKSLFYCNGSKAIKLKSKKTKKYVSVKTDAY